ncbi:MAG: Ppx/GppA family phosphatase [Methanoregulaceae archaeon]|nr:Ppx/GppA family phosphatase [Methanoregulaceae archaeon]MCU0628759.1 Ppx/GppA family phosphatase [Methanoregulaceae archaeon]
MPATERTGDISQERVVAFIDIGTNSIRLLIVRLFPNCTYNVLSRQKETVRLGEGEFDDDLILDDAIDRAVTVCRNFTGLARSFFTDEVVAVATSAAREAKNRNVLQNRLRHEASIDVRVISGRDEARLIYMGVVTGIHLGEKQAVFIDIGGGSTEIAIGGQHTSCHLESLLLGSIRLTNLFFSREEEKPVTRKKYDRIREHVRSVIEPALPGLRSHHFDTVIGSSGTIINLAEIAIKTGNGASTNETGLSRAELSRVADLLCSLPLSLRKKVPGINPERGDIIICGAAILETLMEALSIDRIYTTNRGLQDGLLADYLTRMKDFPLIGSLSVRERSVLQLARSCGINEHHARTVARLAQELFISAKECGLHEYSTHEEELLIYATFLHDVGSFISYNNHHVHSYYLIRNSELAGFLPREILLMAFLARYHRKKPPKKKTLSVLPLGPGDQELIRVLSVFLRMAESLDRSHTGLIRHARFLSVSATGAVLELTAVGECQLELSGIENEADNFRRVFGSLLIPGIVTADLEELHERTGNFPALLNHTGDG